MFISFLISVLHLVVFMELACLLVDMPVWHTYQALHKACGRLQVVPESVEFWMLTLFGMRHHLSIALRVKFRIGLYKAGTCVLHVF
jgi:hypothetical protein